jgi:4-alpha-glucanotransferase
LFCALAELHGPDWSQWPADLRTPAPALAVAHEQRVSFWCWVQQLVDEQLDGIGDGLAIGVLHDLAVGVDAGGADAWAMQDVLALGTSVGAPPDSFNQKGQDWGLPPWRPDRLREAAYAPFREMVRGVLRHAGGIRVDHVLGLSRLWWVPAGRDASEGTYVSYDAEALLGVLALEAVRVGAVVVGEDLGTVEPSFRALLEGSGVLGSAVLWFESSEDGWFLPPADWRRDALASVTTHDLPTAAGWLADEHVRIRSELGQLGHSREQEQARVDQDREMLLSMLRHEGLLAPGGDLVEVVLALHRALVASPCRIVLAAYGDAVGDLRQPNLPGTTDAYPNWRLPLADGAGRPLTLEQVLAHEGVRRLTVLLQQVR